jgi:DNA helicase-2/ATP-dependent DNA helicase PcrA
MEPSMFLSEADQSELRVIGQAPWGFGGPLGGTASGGGFAAPPNAGKGSFRQQGARASSDGRWKQGDRVFHDDHGYGSVTQIREGEDGPVITVRFETGRESNFLSLHQSSRFLKLGDDN